MDVNVVNPSDGRTALDAAKSLRYAGVIKLLEDKAAKPGTPPAANPQRGQRGQ